MQEKKGGGDSHRGFVLNMIKLVKVLMRLAGETVVVELKDGTSVQGTVVGVDMPMNTHLKAVRQTARDGTVTHIDSLTVRGSTIRFVLLPDTLNLDALLLDIETPEPRNLPRERASSRGRGRARGGRGGMGPRGRGGRGMRGRRG